MKAPAPAAPRQETATRRRTGRRAGTVLALALALGTALLAACASHEAPRAPLGQDSFEAYRAQTEAWVRRQRLYQTTDREAETRWNAPQAWAPDTGQPPRQGVLLVHGLGDSPGSFADLGPALARRGALVRTVLLPGHGTRPADLLPVDLDDWRAVVREQAALLRRDLGPGVPLLLGGFSTGANLVLEHALAPQADVQGLLLFSPAFKSRVGMDWVMPWLAPFKPWLRDPDGGLPQQTPLRYMNVPSNGFAQFVRSASAVRAALDQRAVALPALLVLAEHDSVVDVAYVREQFSRRFIHPASRLVWYGVASQATAPAVADARIQVRPDRLDALRISQFSHMAVLFSPDNPQYGRAGRQRICWNGQEGQSAQACQDGAEVWYSDWGHNEPGKYHARLTFNPYFDWQLGVMDEVLAAVPRP